MPHVLNLLNLTNWKDSKQNWGAVKNKRAVETLTEAAFAERYQIGDGFVARKFGEEGVVSLRQVDEFREENFMLHNVQIDSEQTRLQRRAKRVPVLEAKRQTVSCAEKNFRKFLCEILKFLRRKEINMQEIIPTCLNYGKW